MTVVFQIINVLFSLNFGFLKPKASIKLALNLFSFIKCVVLSVLCIHQIYLHEGSTVTFWFSLHLILYLFSVSYLTFFQTDATICNLLAELRNVDLKLSVDDALYNLELKIVISILTCFLHRLIFTLCFCFFSNHCIKPFWATIVFLFIYICLEICHVCYTFIFISVNCRLKKLYLALETAESNFTSFQCIYKSLIDITEKYKTAFDPVVSINYLYSLKEFDLQFDN